MENKSKNFSYYALAIFATTLWGSAFAGAKIGFEYMPPMMLSGFRFMLAGLLLLPMIFIFKGTSNNWFYSIIYFDALDLYFSKCERSGGYGAFCKMRR
ncbi:MAG: EamA family transporter [Bacteroidales bacterium]